MANFIRGNTGVNTGIGRRGSCDADILLAPPSGPHRIHCRGVAPTDLRGRVTLSMTLKSHIFTRVHLLGVISHLEHRGVCGEEGEI